MSHSDEHSLRAARVLVVMGVSGCGKSTVGGMLSATLGVPFLDADDFHPAANVEKMAQGIALTDEDRWPWLDNLGAALKNCANETKLVVTACSALRYAYRERLINSVGETILFIHLQGSRDIIANRIAARSGHFMPAELLDSQFATLEPPAANENALTVQIGSSVSDLSRTILNKLRPVLDLAE